MSSAELPRLALIIFAAVVFIFIIQSYNNSSNNNKQPAVVANNNANVPVLENASVEGFYADGEQTENAPNQGGNMEGAETVTESEGESDDPQASQGSGSENETFKTVGNEVAAAVNNAVGNNLMNEKWASDLMRLNKSFIIERGGKSKKDIYKSLHLSSEFITNSSDCRLLTFTVSSCWTTSPSMVSLPWITSS